MTQASHAKTVRGVRRLSARTALFAAVFAVMVATFGIAIQWDSASAAPIVDEGGANDQPGQKDLTLLEIGTVSNGALPVKWNWDEISSSGANTLDACALFDTDGDGFANFALCDTANGKPTAVQVDTRLYTCNDLRADRCSGAAEVTTFSSTCTTGVTSDDPFAAGAEYPKDLKATCNIVLADVTGASSSTALLNVCSYPSEQPNSDPSDCVLVPRETPLTITKVISGGTLTCANFSFQVDGATAVPFEPDCSNTVLVTPSPNAHTVVEAGLPISGYTTTYANSLNANANCTSLVVPGAGATCTITNTLRTGQFLVRKNFSDDNAANVTISLVCDTGSVVNDDTTASEADPANFTVNGFTGNPDCVATESGVPAGYTAGGSCHALLSVGECTITNTLNTGQFLVRKNFSDDNAANVTISLVCDTGSVVNDDTTASEADPANFTVNGFTGNPDCVATESGVPAGYTAGGSCHALLSVGECTITNTLNTGQFLVRKNFSDDNAANVTISLVCDTGSVVDDDTTASEADPANFTVNGFTGDPDCVATESGVPAGYTAGGSCHALLSVGECTITNTLNTGRFLVRKNFSDDNAANVTISLVCDTGSVVDDDTTASEADPANFTVNGFTGDPDCVATESGVPAGYTAGGSCHALLSVGECTITNTLNTGQFLVRKNFSDDNAANVTISLVCDTGSVVDDDTTASEADPANFTVNGFTGDPDCVATESGVPAGYTAGGSCHALLSVGECTITNTLNTGRFLVRKNFSDDNAANVTISLVCDTGSVVDDDTTASEADPANFTVNGFTGDPDCVATESGVPAGYTAGGSCHALLSVGECTITNTLNTGRFLVRKNFSDDNAANVTISLVCDTGSVVDDDTTASEADPANFTVNGFTGDPDCVATESGVPAGYTAGGSCHALLSVGECTITNTLNTGRFLVRKNFSDDNAANVTISLVCDTGSVVDDDTTASEADPANFTVNGFTGDPDCVATESGVPAGYTAGGSCHALLSVGECTITNTLNTGRFLVRKNFSDDNAANVTISLVCDTGSVVDDDTTASEADPANFTVNGFTGDPDCVATESGVPAGYTAGGSCHALLSVGECTITNTLNSATFTVHKDFSDNNTGSVSVTLACTAGTIVGTNPQNVSEAVNGVWTVTGLAAATNCTATESPVPSGYTSTGTCTASLPATGSASCTITNTVIPSGNLFHTGTTCQQFRGTQPPSGLSGTQISDLFYGTKNGKINNVAPGVFFWYSQFTNTVTLTQTVDNGGNLLNVQQNQILVYDLNCNKLNPSKFVATVVGGVITVTPNIPGNYILSVKYDTSAAVGAPAGPNYTYTFTATGGGNDIDSIVLKPKP